MCIPAAPRNSGRRRTRGTTVLITVLALVLTACGSPEPAAEVAPDGETRTVAHEYGQAEVPADPQRVVVLHGGLVLGTALLLDVPVVGYTRQPAGEGISPYFDESKLTDATDVGWVRQLNIEAITAARPDLIIGQTGFVDSPELHATLSEIAPTVVFEIFGTTPWKESLRTVGEVFGDRDRVEQGIADYEGRIDEVRARLGDAGTTTVTLANFRDLTDIRIYPSSWCSGTTLVDVGLTFPPDQEPNNSEGVSVELLPTLDADRIFYFVGSSTVDTEAEEATAAITQHPLWDTLGAVQRDQAHQVDQSHWFSCGSLQAQNLVLDDVERILGGA